MARIFLSTTTTAATNARLSGGRTPHAGTHDRDVSRARQQKEREETERIPLIVNTMGYLEE